MKIPIHQLDAFASQVFRGNPAAVCPLEAWLPDPLLQAIAAENNLSETAFLVRESTGWRIRWFTPGTEVDLCGHATLASASVVLDQLEPGDRVEFASLSGPLRVERDRDLLVLDFPAWPPVRCEPPAGLVAALGREPLETWKAHDVMAVYATEDEVRGLEPDFGALGRVDAFAVIATAPGRGVDFVSRFFAPRAGISEDPVTGRAHCTLIPYWAGRFGRTVLEARQVSARGGELRCELRGERVRIGGQVARYLEGWIEVPGG